MKRLPVLLFVYLISAALNAQITPENTYNYSGIYTYLPSSGNKFFIMDVAQSQCRIYNTNHNLWKTINLAVPANQWLYDIKYVTEGLFTADNSLCLAYIYYNYNETGQYYTYTAKIVRENGSELLSIPGCQYLLVQTLANGTTKLLAYVYDYSIWPNTVQTKVYNLPGSLVTSHAEKLNAVPQQPAFPNPASHNLTLPWVLPQPYESARLHILDVTGRIIRTVELHGSNGQLQLNVSGLPGGQYVYYIENGDFRTATGKFTLARP